MVNRGKRSLPPGGSISVFLDLGDSFPAVDGGHGGHGGAIYAATSRLDYAGSWRLTLKGLNKTYQRTKTR